MNSQNYLANSMNSPYYLANSMNFFSVVCLPPPPSGALHATSVCPTGEDLPPPERDRGHPSAEIKLLQDGANDFSKRPGRHDIVIAGCASAQVTPRPYPPTHAPHTLSAPPTDPTLRASGSRRPPSGCARSSTRTCSRSRSSLREDERVDRDPRRRAMDLLLIGARGRRAGGRGAGRPKGGPGARGVWGRLHRRALRAWTAGAAAQAGWGRWGRRAGGAVHGCMHAVYRTCERVSV